MNSPHNQSHDIPVLNTSTPRLTHAVPESLTSAETSNGRPRKIHHPTKMSQLLLGYHNLKNELWRHCGINCEESSTFHNGDKKNLKFSESSNTNKVELTSKLSAGFSKFEEQFFSSKNHKKTVQPLSYLDNNTETIAPKIGKEGLGIEINSTLMKKALERNQTTKLYQELRSNQIREENRKRLQ